MSAGPERALVGPFPPGSDPEAYDRLRRRLLWRMPSGLYLLGSSFGGRRNLMTHNWAVQVSIDPKLLAVAIRHGSLTQELVLSSQAFSLNFVRRADRALVRAFTNPAVEDVENGALSGVEVATGLTGAPIVKGAPAWFECQVRQHYDVGDHGLFVGEIVNCSAPDEGADLLRMEDTRLNYGG